MTELVYLRSMRGGVTARIWRDGLVGCGCYVETNTRGNPVDPYHGDQLVRRIKIPDDEAGLGIDELVRRYPPRTT